MSGNDAGLWPTSLPLFRFPQPVTRLLTRHPDSRGIGKPAFPYHVSLNAAYEGGTVFFLQYAIPHQLPPMDGRSGLQKPGCQILTITGKDSCSLPEV